jgi:hypothetical protein
MSGVHIPLDSPYAEQTFRAVLNGEMRPLTNNMPDTTLILYRNIRGTVQVATDTEMVGGSDFIVIPAEGYDPPEEAKDGWPFIDVSAVKNEHVDMQEHLINSLIAGSRSANPSKSSYIAYRSPYGHTGLIELPDTDTAEVVILPGPETQ